MFEIKFAKREVSPLAERIATPENKAAAVSV